MKKRTERTLKELYDLTEMMLEPEITPVLKGCCRIQGPADDLDLKNRQTTDSDEKKFMFPKERSAMRIESGTCTVCSAPCSLCMHHNSESGSSCNLSVRTEADCSSVINVDAVPIHKSSICDELQPAASEASNLLSTSSSHDSYLENAESKASLTVSPRYDASDDVNMPDVLFSVERCTNMDNVGCSLASFTGGNCPENKSVSIPNHEVSTSGTEIGFSSGATSSNGLCPDARLGADCKKSSGSHSEECLVNDLLGNDGAVLDAVKGQDQLIQPQATTVGENYESDVALDDVKVCDICGDVGREDHLAICSKCSDGAEHTYCMQEMLNKAPEGEWLCEECKIKETESQNVNECEEVYEKLKSACLNDINQNSKSTLIPKQTHKSDARTTNFDRQGSAKEVQGPPHISIRRLVGPFDEGKASELSGASMERASPREKPFLSRQISSKSQMMGNSKTTRTEPSSEVHFSKGSEAFSRSKTCLSSSSFKGLPPLYSPLRKFSRSLSFNNANVNPKVKTLIENAPPKKEITREPTTNELRKGNSFKTSTNTLFKNKNSECSNNKLASKSSSLQPSHSEDLRALKEVKDRNTGGNKKFSTKGKYSVQPSADITTNHPLKADAKSVQNDGIWNNVSETNVCSLSEGFDADSNGGKKQISYSSKNIESHDANNPKGIKITKEAIRRSFSAADGSHRKVEIVSPSSAIQPPDSGHKDGRTTDSTIHIGSRLSTLGRNRTFHSQRSNETGLTIQDKHGRSAHRTSAEQNPREVEKKGNKWRELVNSAMSRSRVLKGEKPDTLDELPTISADMICEAASKHESSAFNQKPSVVENNIGKVSSKDSFNVSNKSFSTIGSAQLPILSVDGSVKANDTTDTINGTELRTKSFADILLGEAPLLANPLSRSAVPKLECIWQGSFNVIATRSYFRMFFGIQAHLSTCASPKVFKLATKLPGQVLLEEVSLIRSWPLQLLRTGPQDENIALFFFAQDAVSYDKCYRKLMDRMHKNDLALRGIIEGAELLIFTSKKLPMNSQRWNRMHYLWGIFRDGVSNAQRLQNSSKLKILSDYMPSEEVSGEFNNVVSLPPITSDFEDKIRKILEVSPVQNVLNEVPAVPQVTQEQPLVSVRSLPGTKAEPLNVITDAPNSRLQLTTKKSCSEENYNGNCQEKFFSDCTNKKAGNSPALTYEIVVESSNRRVPSGPSVSPNCNKGSDCINIEGNIKETTPSIVPTIDNERGTVLRTDHLVCDSTANRKRERSSSAERMPQVFDEMPNKIVEMVLPKEWPSWLPVEHEREQKKTCYDSFGIIVGDNPSAARLSSKVHPLYSSFLEQQQPVESLSDETSKPQSVRNTEICFFQVDLGPLHNTRCSMNIDIPANEEDALESGGPDLELALGWKSKSKKPFAISSLFPSVDGGKQLSQPGSLWDADDASASLSLSL